MCDEDYKPIDEEMLYEVPVEEQPQSDPKRNFFDECQPVKPTTKDTKGHED